MGRKFRVGQRVKMTAHGIYSGLARGSWGGKPMPTTGVVVRVGPSPLSVRVLRDGRKLPGDYHAAFWEADRTRKRR
jgi:hypothetical protein